MSLRELTSVIYRGFHGLIKLLLIDKRNNTKG